MILIQSSSVHDQSKTLCVYVAHKAMANTLLQFPWSLSASSVDVHYFPSSLSISASTVLRHVVRGRPFFHLPSDVQVSAILVLSDVSHDHYH